MKLFYVPHAGGSATSMHKWSGDLMDIIEPIPIELAGRGERYNEEPYASIMEAVKDILDMFKEHAGDEDYVLVGHSMGATIIYELYYNILESGLKLPIHMFFSGSKPPHTKQENEKIHRLEDDLFLKEIKKYGGLSDEMLTIDKFKRLYTPLLKKDYRIMEEYTFANRMAKIECNISVMYGNEDLSYEELRGWRRLANTCYYEAFNGGHFYMDSNRMEFASYINRRIREEYEIRGE